MQNKINAKYTSVPVLKKREEFYKSNIDNFAVVSDIRKIIEHYWTRDDLYFQKCFSYHNRTLFYTKNDKEIALIDNLQKVSDLFLTLMFLE
jgi:hypothetical protein